MNIRCRIWEELKQAKANIICLQKYIDKKRSRNRWYNVFVAVVSSVGALGYTINELVPVYTSILVGVISIAKSIMPNFLQTEPELSELDNLSNFYVSYMNSLERIWYDYENNHMNDKATVDAFFELKESECDKQSVMNRGVRSISRRFQSEINEEAEVYINRVYFEQYPNNEAHER